MKYYWKSGISATLTAVLITLALLAGYADAEISFTYTPTGQRKTATDSRGVTGYEYDLRDRLKKVTNPDGSVMSYTYDAAGNRTSVTVSSGTTTYAYDALNRLETVTDPDGGVTKYTYDRVGNRKTVTYPNGTVARFMYDRLDRIIKIENRKAGGELISGYIYTLGPAGNRLRVEEPHSGRVVSYKYDDLHRLTEEKIIDPADGNETISYVYDNFGNRLAKTDSSGTVTYGYDSNDRLKREAGPAGVVTYTYDNNGSTLTKDDGTGAVTYGYDRERRLLSVRKPGSLTEYACDADGTRVRSVTDGVSLKYVVDKNRRHEQVLEERDGDGLLVAAYVYGDDLISRRRGGSVLYYHYDGLGSVTALTDGAGNVTDTCVYEAFGGLLRHDGEAGNNYLFAGEQYDPNADFYYLRIRYYNTGNGRFLTSDSWRGNMARPRTLNKYVYADANPVNRTDPSGHFSIGEINTAFTIRNILTDLQIDTGMNLADAHGKAQEGENGDEHIEELIFSMATGLNPKVFRLMDDRNKKRLLRVFGCFAAGTPVQSDEGLCPVEEIKVDDNVLACDEVTGEMRWCRVTGTSVRHNQQIIELQFEDEGGNTEKIYSTVEHPFRLENYGWIAAKDILSGDEVPTSSGGSVKLLDSTLSSNQTVYNFEVVGLHNYFVGKFGVWVHNASKIPPFRMARIDAKLERKLKKLVGQADATKFRRAIDKGVVGPQSQSGIKPLDLSRGGGVPPGYAYELKIGGSGQRLLDKVVGGELIFDKFKRGGLH